MTTKWIGLCVAAMSGHAWAVIDGEPVDWQAHDNTVQISKCTGTRIGGAFVLTAAHCETNVGLEWIKDAHHDEYQYIVEHVYLHPNYEPNYVTEDVALAKLSQTTDYAYIQFFDDLSEPTYEQDAPITIDGFGGANNHPPTRAKFELYYQGQNYPFRIEANQNSIASLTEGDSGSVWVDQNNHLIATTYGIARRDDGQQISGIDLHYAADFILETINGWHYPTIAKANGKTTIEVQSLHLGGTTDAAYASGDARIVVEDSSCLVGSIAPFKRCTYVIDSNGGKGTLHLSDTESIRINSASSGGSNGGDSGGGAGWTTLIVLLGLWRQRHIQENLVYTDNGKPS